MHRFPMCQNRHMGHPEFMDQSASRHLGHPPTWGDGYRREGNNWKRPLGVVTTNPNAKITGPAKNNPDIVHKPLNQ